MTIVHDRRLEAIAASGDWRLLDAPLSLGRCVALAWMLWRHPYHLRVVARERFIVRQTAPKVRP